MSVKTNCEYCGVRFDFDHPPTTDHIVPVSKGGSRKAFNLAKVCVRCNNVKADFMPYVFLDSIQWYLKNIVPLKRFTFVELAEVYKNLSRILVEREMKRDEGFAHTERLNEKPEKNKKGGGKTIHSLIAQNIARAKLNKSLSSEGQKPNELSGDSSGEYRKGTSVVYRKDEETYYGYLFETWRDGVWSMETRYYKEMLGFNHPDRFDIPDKRRFVKYVGTFTKIKK